MNLLTLPLDMVREVMEYLPYPYIKVLEQAGVPINWTQRLQRLILATPFGGAVDSLRKYRPRESDEQLFAFVDSIQSSPYATIHMVYADQDFRTEGMEYLDDDADIAQYEETIDYIENLSDDDYLLLQIKEIPLSLLRPGDLIENTDESGYRSGGVSMIDRENGQVVSVPLNTDWDDYGSPATRFTYPTYPVDYWDYNQMKSTGQGAESYCHTDESYFVALDPNVKVISTYVSLPVQLAKKVMYIDPRKYPQGIIPPSATIPIHLYSTFEREGKRYLLLGKISQWSQLGLLGPPGQTFGQSGQHDLFETREWLGPALLLSRRPGGVNAVIRAIPTKIRFEDQVVIDGPVAMWLQERVPHDEVAGASQF